MGRQKMTPGDRAERARRNSFEDDLTGIDDAVVLRPIVPYTTMLYGRQWESWLE
ncbi:MAG: hypothetical protein M1832_003535 [Thelocarpon impressellum]|nr:MAG: hypothetical protein M1832_003535 [Thelocarpon impressellum]